MLYNFYMQKWSIFIFLNNPLLFASLLLQVLFEVVNLTIGRYGISLCNSIVLFLVLFSPYPPLILLMYIDFSIWDIWKWRSFCSVEKKSSLLLVNIINFTFFSFFKDNKLFKQKFWVKHKCWLFSPCQKRRNIVFIRTKGLWWWFWILGLHWAYWSNLHPVSKNNSILIWYNTENSVNGVNYDIRRYFLPV